MIDISTKYMNLDLKNPIIVSSSMLTGTLKNLKKCEDNSAGAVVLKSIFEEQLDIQSASCVDNLDSSQHAEAYDFLNKSSENYYLDQYLKFIEDAKNTISIPVIASLNCHSIENWVEYAKRIEAVGADAIELNMYILPSDVNISGKEIEERYINIIKNVKKAVKIPVAAKLGSNFSGMLNFFKKLDNLGVDALVLFNRFYNIDFNIESQRLVAAKMFSTNSEKFNALRWTALTANEIDADIAANTGIHTGDDVIKMLLAGAKAVEICSAFYQNGLEHIESMLEDLQKWMERHSYKSIDDFRGSMAQDKAKNPEMYERSQYIKVITGLE